MISKNAIESLNLKNYTIKSCLDMYQEVTTKYKSTSELEKALDDAGADPEFLNKMWWVLNYHSNVMDNSRRLRAMLETRLDVIAKQKHDIYA